MNDERRRRKLIWAAESARRWKERDPEGFRQNTNERGRNWRHVYRAAALILIANVHGDDEPRCRTDVQPLPNNAGRPCHGILELDHKFGGGSIDKRKHGAAIFSELTKGERDPFEYRILCTLHNRWNAGSPQGRARGGQKAVKSGQLARARERRRGRSDAVPLDSPIITAMTKYLEVRFE